MKDNDSDCLCLLTLCGAVLPPAPWGRLLITPSYRLKPKTQRGDVPCPPAWKCSSWESNPELCDSQASPLYPFPNLALHVFRVLPRPQVHAPAPWLLHPSGSPAYPHRWRQHCVTQPTFLVWGKSMLLASCLRIGSYQVREDVGQDSVH